MLLLSVLRIMRVAGAKRYLVVLFVDTEGLSLERMGQFDIRLMEPLF